MSSTSWSARSSLADGGMIFDAAMKVRELEAQYNIALPEDPAYETIGGFVLNRLGFIPRGGESFEDRRIPLHGDGDGSAPRLARENQKLPPSQTCCWRPTEKLLCRRDRSDTASRRSRNRRLRDDRVERRHDRRIRASRRREAKGSAK